MDRSPDIVPATVSGIVFHSVSGSVLPGAEVRIAGQVGTDDLGPLGALRVARCATRHTPPDVQPPLTRLPRGDSGLEHDRGGVW